MKTITTLAIGLALFACGCPMVTEGTMTGSDSSSSSSDAGDDDVTTLNTVTTVDGSESDDSDSSGDETESSSGGDDTDASTEESSTGEPLPPDWALEFDGTSRGVKIGDGGEYEWTAPNFTIEAWVQILDTDATGIIFASENLASTAGWAFYFHPDWRTFVFSYLDGTQSNRLTMGSTIEEIGEGWHHLAATKDEDTVYLHVDGVAVVVDNQANGAMSSAGGTIWTIGGTATADPTSFWRLKDTVIDDVRISEFSRYSGNFDPPVVFEDDCGAACTINLILTLDEGEGIVVGDDASGVDFTIDAPEWVEGYTGG